MPGATYRVQLRPGFGFDDAAAVVPYLAALGVTHLYASPYLQAAPGSTHGYDVVDHTRVNEELGGVDGHDRLCRALSAAGLGQVLDIVPNHMATGPGNRLWWDLLENGPASEFAHYFDVDWNPPEPALRLRVLLPVLADHYGRVLDAGELRLERAGDGFVVRYGEQAFPIDPRTDDALHDDAGLAAVNADPERLHELLERQNYRLAYWRAADQDLDYRRFFDVDALVGLRVEDESVFASTHRLVLGWLGDGTLDGVRVDHPDGLLDPPGYLARLRARAPGSWIVVEKILEGDESLPTTWPVHGTTGYDFLCAVTSLLVDRRGEAPITDAYVSFTGEAAGLSQVIADSKHLVLDRVLAAEVRRLTGLFVDTCEQERRYRDFTRVELRAALVELLAAFPVYRTYVRPGRPVTAADAASIETAIELARAHRPDLDPELFELLGRALRGELSGPAAELCLRVQQTTGAVMAKAVEDTAFYRYNRFVALNEVGSDPDGFGSSVAEFHEAMVTSWRDWPEAMLASSTHDTKRSEDVRARLAVLSELPHELAAAVGRWSKQNERHRTGDLPDRNLEWLLYQTLIGAHPLPVDRALAYVEKATKEAKQHTSWTNPVPEYDEAVRRFVEGVLDDDAFTAELAAFVDSIADAGWCNALSAQLLKLTCPGVPDVYQGTELWDLSLVDPDNRRPVDFELRQRLLGQLDRLDVDTIWAKRAEGLPKLYLTRQALALRPSGPYEPLAVDGDAADHLVAFSRGGAVTALAPRLPVGLSERGGWGDTTVELPSGRWTDVLTGETVGGGRQAVGGLLHRFPVGLLRKDGA